MCQKINYTYACCCVEPIVKYCSNYRQYNECNNVRYGNEYISCACYGCERYGRARRNAVVTEEAKSAEEVEQEKEETKVQM